MNPLKTSAAPASLDTCPTASEVCCMEGEGQGLANCQPREKACPENWTRRECDGTEDCPAGLTCQLYTTTRAGDWSHVCSKWPIGSTVCHPGGHCSAGEEVCTHGSGCSTKGTRCVKDPTGTHRLCMPTRPPLRCGVEVCTSADAPICIVASDRPPRCGSYDENPPDTMECFRDADCEKGTVCCVGGAGKTLCLGKCDFFSQQITAICEDDDDCKRYYLKHRAERERSGIKSMFCDKTSWRGIGGCTGRR